MCVSDHELLTDLILHRARLRIAVEVNDRQSAGTIRELIDDAERELERRHLTVVDEDGSVVATGHIARESIALVLRRRRWSIELNAATDAAIYAALKALEMQRAVNRVRGIKPN